MRRLPADDDARMKACARAQATWSSSRTSNASTWDLNGARPWERPPSCRSGSVVFRSSARARGPRKEFSPPERGWSWHSSGPAAPLDWAGGPRRRPICRRSARGSAQRSKHPIRIGECRRRALSTCFVAYWRSRESSAALPAHVRSPVAAPLPAKSHRESAPSQRP